MLNIANYERNAHQKYNEVSTRTGQNGHHQKVCKQKGPSYTVGGNVIGRATTDNSMKVP